MSGGDLLDRATRAVREGTDGVSSDAGKTRARVMAMAAKGGKRTRRVTAIVPLAAVLAVSTAWAETHGGLAQVWHRVESSLTAAPVDAVGPTTGARSGRAVGSIAAPREPDTVPPDPIAGPPAPNEVPAAPALPTVSIDSLPRISASTSTSTSTSTPTSTPTPTSTSPTDDPSAALYATAHRAHFVDHDPSAALRAWDAYLEAAPDGPFAPEAHYNRAITLVRLHRIDEARRALAPFADGAYGTYRAREAREILGALRDE